MAGDGFEGRVDLFDAATGRGLLYLHWGSMATRLERGDGIPERQRNSYSAPGLALTRHDTVTQAHVADYGWLSPADSLYLDSLLRPPNNWPPARQRHIDRELSHVRLKAWLRPTGYLDTVLRTPRLYAMARRLTHIAGGHHALVAPEHGRAWALALLEAHARHRLYINPPGWDGHWVLPPRPWLRHAPAPDWNERRLEAFRLRVAEAWTPEELAAFAKTYPDVRILPRGNEHLVSGYAGAGGRETALPDYHLRRYGCTLDDYLAEALSPAGD